MSSSNLKPKQIALENTHPLLLFFLNGRLCSEKTAGYGMKTTSTMRFTYESICISSEDIEKTTRPERILVRSEHFTRFLEDKHFLVWLEILWRGPWRERFTPRKRHCLLSSAAGTYSLKMAGRLKRQTPLTHTISRLVKSEAGRMLPNASEPLVCQLVSWNKWIKVIVPIIFNRSNCVTSPGLKLQGFKENTGILVITMLHKLVFWRSLCLLSLRTVSHLRINKSARSFQRFGSWECQRQYMGSSESFN